MGVKYYTRDNHIELSVSGSYALSDAFAALDKAIKAACGRLPLLLDITESNKTRTQEELRDIADAYEKRAGLMTPRIAVLVPDKLRFGLARQISAYLAGMGVECNPFYERETALDWLIKKIAE